MATPARLPARASGLADYSDRTEGGWPPFDRVLMSKILAIQATNNLSDDALTSLLMADCRSCGPWDWDLRIAFWIHRVPDAPAATKWQWNFGNKICLAPQQSRGRFTWGDQKTARRTRLFRPWL